MIILLWLCVIISIVMFAFYLKGKYEPTKFTISVMFVIIILSFLGDIKVTNKIDAINEKYQEHIDRIDALNTYINEHIK